MINNLIARFKELSIKNIILCVLQTIIVIAMIVASVRIKDTGTINISNYGDGYVVMDAKNNILAQSYQLPERSIKSIAVIADPENSYALSGTLTCCLSADKSGTEVLASAEAYPTTGATVYYFDFGGDIKVNPGTRYYFVLTFTPSGPFASDAKLAIKTMSDYAGLTLSGNEVKGAMNASIYYSYPGRIGGILKIVLLLSAITILYMLIFDRGFGACIAMTFATAFLYLLLFGFFGFLDAGVKSLYVVGMIIALFLPFIAMLKGRRWSDIISPAFLGFWGLTAVYFVLDKDLVLGKADDLNHWQLAVRDMWFSDSLAFHPGNAYRIPRYTPGFAMIEYLFVRLFGTYREGILLIAAHATGFAFMSPMMDKIEWKKCIRIPFIALLIATLPILIYSQYSGILYVDSYLGILGAFLFICYFTEDYSLFQVIRITLGSILLIMTKEFGLVIAFSFYVAVIIDILIKNKGFKGFFKLKNTIAYFASGVLSVMSFVMWQIYCHFGTQRLIKTEALANVGVSAGQMTKITTEALIGTSEAGITKFFSPMETITEFARWVVRDDIYMTLSFAQILFIVMFIAILICMSRKFVDTKIRYREMTITVFVGMLIYIAALILAYIFIFNEDTATPAEDRYVGSYLLLVMIVVVGTLVTGLNNTENKSFKGSFLVVGVCLCVTFVMPQYHFYYTTAENFGSFYRNWDYYRTLSEPVRTFADRGETIFYIGYDTNPDYIYENYITFHNAIVPSLSQGFEDWRPVVDDETDYGLGTVKYSADDLAYVLSAYDYLYIRDFDDYFRDNYSVIFENDEDVVCGGFYRIDKADDGSTIIHKIAYKNLQ